MGSTRLKNEHGQAAVELLAVIPLVAVVLAGGWQIALAGHTWWAVSEAARLAAREVAVGRAHGDLDPVLAGRRAAAAVIPRASRDSLDVELVDQNVRVGAAVPLVFPFSAAGDGPMIRATTRFGS